MSLNSLELWQFSENTYLSVTAETGLVLVLNPFYTEATLGCFQEGENPISLNANQAEACRDSL